MKIIWKPLYQAKNVSNSKILLSHKNPKWLSLILPNQHLYSYCTTISYHVSYDMHSLNLYDYNAFVTNLLYSYSYCIKIETNPVTHHGSFFLSIGNHPLYFHAINIQGYELSNKSVRRHKTYKRQAQYQSTSYCVMVLQTVN